MTNRDVHMALMKCNADKVKAEQKLASLTALMDRVEHVLDDAESCELLYRIRSEMGVPS